jgi:hypothetical protein
MEFVCAAKGRAEETQMRFPRTFAEVTGRRRVQNENMFRVNDSVIRKIEKCGYKCNIFNGYQKIVQPRTAAWHSRPSGQRGFGKPRIKFKVVSVRCLETGNSDIELCE